MIRRVLAVALILLLIAGSASTFGQRKPKRSKGKSVKQLEKGLKSVQQSKQKATQQLAKVKRQANVVTEDISKVESRLDAVEAAFEKTTDELGDNRARQIRINSELTKATAKLDATREQVRLRLKRIYMQGQTGFLSVMVSSKSTGEIASRKFLLERIAQKDRQIFAEFTRYQKFVTRKKKEQDQVVARIARLAAEQRQQQNNLAAIRSEKTELLGALKDKESELAKMIRQFEADEAAIASDIQAAIRRAQAEAKRTGTAPKKFSGGRFARPCNGSQTSGFGMRFHPIMRRNKLHAGIDFGAPSGSPVFAAGDGTVISASRMGGYGNVIIIDHGGGIATVYAHLSRIGVGSGSTVRKGQKIGAVGSTGMSTGPHLHFEVRVNGRPVNPSRYL